jgi:hypothetical protein
MGIGAFGIDPASKFATEKRKTPKRKLALLYLRIPLPGSGQLSGRVARGSTSRKAACGSAFRLFFSYRARLPTRDLVRRHHVAVVRFCNGCMSQGLRVLVLYQSYIAPTRETPGTTSLSSPSRLPTSASSPAIHVPVTLVPGRRMLLTSPSAMGSSRVRLS